MSASAPAGLPLLLVALTESLVLELRGHWLPSTLQHTHQICTSVSKQFCADLSSLLEHFKDCYNMFKAF